MSNLSSGDLRAVLTCTEALQTARTLQQLPTHIVELLSPLVGSDVSFCSSFTDRCHNLAATTTEMFTLRLEPEYFKQNPLIRRYLKTGDCDAYKISDFLSEQQLYCQESLYRGWLRPLGVADQLAMVIPPTTSHRSLHSFPKQYFTPNDPFDFANATTLGNLALGFHRSDRSFSEREREMLNLIRPHVVHAYCNSQIYTKQQQQLEQMSQAFNALGSIILSPGGRVQVMSERASQLLGQYFPEKRAVDQLPNTLQSWVSAQIRRCYENVVAQPRRSLRIEHLGRQLIIRLLGSVSIGSFILSLEENKQQILSVETLRLTVLTQRESEVLIFIAEGKNNAEIANTLVLGEKTVKKHVENILKKLDVKNRTAAVMVVLEQLGMLE